MTYRDIRVRLRVYGGQKQAEIVQQFQSMNAVMASMFPSEGTKGTSENLKPATTVEEVKDGFARIFG